MQTNINVYKHFLIMKIIRENVVPLHKSLLNEM